MKGPRLGRKGKPVEQLPQPRPNAKLPRRRRGTKIGGRDFAKGHNGHTGEVFRRDKDQLPRGNGTLLLRVVYHDARERFYNSLIKLADDPKTALAFMQEYIDRTEGKPGKQAAASTPMAPTFVLQMRDGTEVPMLPAGRVDVGQGSTPAGAAAPAGRSGLDAFILGSEAARA
jgi:hypothetical protein